MARRSGERFSAIRTEGGLLPSDLLEQLLQRDAKLDGLNETAYHVVDVRLHEAITESWTRIGRVWGTFQGAIGGLANTDPGTSVTRERWLLPLFHELGYGRLPTARPVEVGGEPYPISHLWQHFPVHLVGWNVDLGERTRGVAGAARVSPHGLVQELLSRSSAHLWGAVSNGRQLRLLRDNVSLTRQAYLEFDLEAMFRGEHYSDFAVLWLLLHQSRVEADRPEHCWLERWAQEAHRQGLRVLDRLRVRVQEAIVALGRGFLAHPRNERLRQSLRSGDLDPLGYYWQLLKMVYRLLFLFVAEDRDLLVDPAADKAAKERYVTYYSTARLRELAGHVRGTSHGDLWQTLRLVMTRLGADTGCPELGLPPLGSFLWSGEATPDLDGCELANRDLLVAIRALAWTEEDRIRRPVDYRNLGPEELGSVYEALLELHPEINTEAPTFALTTASGHERKTTGSYYTPRSLIQALLDSALDPVLDDAARTRNPEAAILSRKVCDPACGSGHFLIAAAHRIARRLAAVRTGDDEPAPEALRHALRDVIGHCIYGVDVNDMAVELCKVALWMEALEPGKPLSFLDHRILCGNSLLGTTPALIARGVPDHAFEPIEGDDKKVASEWRKRNRREREGQMELPMVAEPGSPYGELGSGFAQLSAMGDETIGRLRERERRHRDLLASSAYQRTKLLANAWCAAFVWRKVAGGPASVTEDILRRLESDPRRVPADTIAEVERVARQYRFLHWHLAFPDVFRLPKRGEAPGNRETGWSGGFDVVLGNPPWELLLFREQEFFANTRPDIASAATGAARKRLIRRLQAEDQSLYERYLAAARLADGTRTFLQNSGRFPLTGRGRTNTYGLFAELMASILRTQGRAACIVPTGIATDDSTKLFFQAMVKSGRLLHVFDFENRRGLFPEVDSRARFSLVGISGAAGGSSTVQLAFYLADVADLAEDGRIFLLRSEDFAALNPNTRTCPVFRDAKDARISLDIYSRLPILLRETPEMSPWGIVTKPGLFNMTGDSDIFESRDPLERRGFRLVANRLESSDEIYLPLYEGKMFDFFDHRFAHVVLSETAAIRQGQSELLTAAQHEDPTAVPLPRYWVSRREVESRLAGEWDRQWILGWKEVTSATNERTLIPSLLPSVGIGHKIPVMLPSPPHRLLTPCLAACLASFACDYVCRQKLSSTSLTPFTVKQLPVLPPDAYRQAAPWSSASIAQWLMPRLVELYVTAWDMMALARDFGIGDSPYRWDERRRLALRCELDAAFFHLYGITGDDVDYIMDTFRIVRRRDEERYGEYRRKRMILEIYDALQKAIGTGRPYQTILDPPPADARVAHPPTSEARA
jgi:hypothetical protein